MKLELSIKADYLPKWGSFEAIRELVSNGRDAETEFGAPLEVRHRRDANVLVIENAGCTIPHEALLFGHTTKLGRDGGLIGKFGEGLKLAMLVLARAGHSVRIRSGSEVWIPKIERSEKFNADVLTVTIEKGRADKDRVQIEVDQISTESWEVFRKLFLFLAKPAKDEHVKTSSGALLFGDDFAGKLFVKGIFVTRMPAIQYGYDFSDVEVDRDRKMIDQYDLAWRMRAIWNDAMNSRPSLSAKFLTLLGSEAKDIEGVDEFGAKYLPDVVLGKAAKDFRLAYGENAVPVATLAESKDIEHLGKRGVIVNKPLRAVLQATMGTTESVKEGLKKEVTKLYGWGDLSPAERASFDGAVALIGKVVDLGDCEIEVVDFRSENLLGLFEPSKDAGGKDKIHLAKKSLVDRKETLATLVHEVSHREGNDGDHGHVARIEEIWSAICESLRGAP